MDYSRTPRKNHTSGTQKKSKVCAEEKSVQKKSDETPVKIGKKKPDIFTQVEKKIDKKLKNLMSLGKKEFPDSKLEADMPVVKIRSSNNGEKKKVEKEETSPASLSARTAKYQLGASQEGISKALRRNLDMMGITVEDSILLSWNISDKTGDKADKFYNELQKAKNACVAHIQEQFQTVNADGFASSFWQGELRFLRNRDVSLGILLTNIDRVIDYTCRTKTIEMAMRASMNKNRATDEILFAMLPRFKKEYVAIFSRELNQAVAASQFDSLLQTMLLQKLPSERKEKYRALVKPLIINGKHYKIHVEPAKFLLDDKCENEGQASNWNELDDCAESDSGPNLFQAFPVQTFQVKDLVELLPDNSSETVASAILSVLGLWMEPTDFEPAMMKLRALYISEKGKRHKKGVGRDNAEETAKNKFDQIIYAALAEKLKPKLQASFKEILKLDYSDQRLKILALFESLAEPIFLGELTGATEAELKKQNFVLARTLGDRTYFDSLHFVK